MAASGFDLLGFMIWPGRASLIRRSFDQIINPSVGCRPWRGSLLFSECRFGPPDFLIAPPTRKTQINKNYRSKNPARLTGAEVIGKAKPAVKAKQNSAAGFCLGNNCYLLTRIILPNKNQRQSPTKSNEQMLKPLDATKGKNHCPYWRNKYLQKR